MRFVSLQRTHATVKDGRQITFAREPFDSEVFGLEIGRIHSVHAGSAAGYRVLFDSVLAQARGGRYDQVLRRTSLLNLPEIWALEASGFELMDVVVTFARRVLPGNQPPQWPDLRIEPATDATAAIIARDMANDPWGSRYEADPRYDAEQVRELRRRWLVNSHRGRAQAFFIGIAEGRPVGYVTCLLREQSGEGEIELVGTVPGFRGRRIAPRIIQHALCWFGERCEVVTVRTQATNISAATVYERAGFTLRGVEATYRANVTGRRME